MAKKDKMLKCQECANLDRERSNENWVVCPVIPLNVMAGAPATECAKFVPFNVAGINPMTSDTDRKGQ